MSNMKKLYYPIAVASAVMLTATVFAQTNTSPYSIAGIGDIEPGYSDRSAGMANAGVSLSSSKNVYGANPASLSALDDHFFALELNTRFRATNYYGTFVTQDNSSSSDMQVSRLAMSIKVKSRWGASVSLSPYSSSNYSFYSNKEITGTTNTTYAHYTGSGGLYQFNFANGFRVNKNLSLGLSASFIFGSLKQDEVINTTLTTDSIVTTHNMYLNKLLPKAGFQYHAKISKNLSVNIGAAATPKTKMNADYTLTVKEGATTLVDDQPVTGTRFTLPLNYTGGLSVVYKDYLTLAVDYQQQQWDQNTYKGGGLGYSLTNSDRLSAGLQYAKLYKYGKQTFEHYYLQAGGYYSNTYLVVKGQQLKDYGFTMGAGINSKKTQLGYQLNLNVGARGTTNNGLLKENYTQLSFTLFYRDFWYTKVKKYN